MNLISNPSMGGWVPNPNLTRIAPEEDDIMDLPEAADAADLRYEESEGSQNLEMLAMKFEENVAAEKRNRWTGQERWQGRENLEKRLVNILHPNAFMRKLQAAGVDARIEFSKYARLWLNDSPRVGRLGISAWVADETTEARTVRTVTTLQDAGSPEWSVMGFNQYNVPTAERYRGWRTALLHLIIANVITEDEAHLAFGTPVMGDVSEFYRQQLQTNRARRMGLQV